MGVGVSIGHTDVVVFIEVGAGGVGCIPMFVCGGDIVGGVAVVVIGSHVGIDVNVVSCVSAAIQDSDWVFLLIFVVGVGDFGIGVEGFVVCWRGQCGVCNHGLVSSAVQGVLVRVVSGVLVVAIASKRGSDG